MKELRQYDTMGDVSTYQITEKDGKERWVSITSQAELLKTVQRPEIF